MVASRVWRGSCPTVHKTFAGSDIICDRFNEVNRSSISLPSGVLSSSCRQNWEYSLKSQARNVAKGFSALILEYKFGKLDKPSNKWEPCLEAGHRYNTVKIFVYIRISVQWEELVQTLFSLMNLSWKHYSQIVVQNSIEYRWTK